MPPGIGYPPATDSGFMSQARRMNPSFQNPAAAPIDQQDILPPDISLPDTIAAASGAPATPGPFDTVTPPKPSIKPPRNMPFPPNVPQPVDPQVAMMAGQNVGRNMSGNNPFGGAPVSAVGPGVSPAQQMMGASNNPNQRLIQELLRRVGRGG
jgi:hypothetical protein